MNSNFAVHTHTTGRAITLTLTGELDLLSSPVLERGIDAVADSEAELVIVDLRGVEFMDSTGLHAVLNGRQRMHDLGRRFILIRGGDSVQRVLDLSGVTDGLTIVDSPDELLEAHGA